MKKWNSLHTFLRNASEKEKEAALNYVNRSSKSQVKKELVRKKKELDKLQKEIQELEQELQPEN